MSVSGGGFVDVDIDFEWCRERRGQVIVCEQVGASWLPFVPVEYAVKAAAGGGRGTSAEAIWTNSPASEPQLSFDLASGVAGTERPGR